jgi:hypothetical protein
MQTSNSKTVATMIRMTMALSYGAKVSEPENVGPEGWKVTAATLADVAKAEAAADKLRSAYGIEVLVAF